MKTKLTIGCLGAITILILVSFTNVVGIQSTTSGSMNDSPLFSIKTNKAINNDNNRVITSDYPGKGLNALPFPLRDNRTTLIQKVIGIIQKMDDKEFNRFQSLILLNLYEDKNTRNIDTTHLVTFLKQLKSDTKELKIILNNKGNNANNDPPTMLTAYDGCCPTFDFRYCFIIVFVLFILLFPPLLLCRLLTLDFICSSEI